MFPTNNVRAMLNSVLQTMPFASFGRALKDGERVLVVPDLDGATTTYDITIDESEMRDFSVTPAQEPYDAVEVHFADSGSKGADATVRLPDIEARRCGHPRFHLHRRSAWGAQQRAGRAQRSDRQPLPRVCRRMVAVPSWQGGHCASRQARTEQLRGHQRQGAVACPFRATSISAFWSAQVPSRCKTDRRNWWA